MRQLNPAAIDDLVRTLRTASLRSRRGPGIYWPSPCSAECPNWAPWWANYRLSHPMDWTGTSLAVDAPPWAEFGVRVDEASQAVARLARTGYMPGTYTEGDGLVAFLAKLTTWMDTAGPDLKALQPAIQSLA